MTNNPILSKTYLALTIPLSLLLLPATGCGVFVDGLYRDIPYFAALVKDQDLLSLTTVMPTMIVSAWLARRNHPRAILIWQGVLAYLVFSYAIAAFSVKYNPLFLVYVALLGVSLYALIGSLSTLKKAPVKIVRILPGGSHASLLCRLVVGRDCAYTFLR